MRLKHLNNYGFKTINLICDYSIYGYAIWFKSILLSLWLLDLFPWIMKRNRWFERFIELQMSCWYFIWILDGNDIWFYILPPSMRCMNVLRWYMHIWNCYGCYCAIDNKALDYRTVKGEGPYRANVVEGLAVKYA